jgi:hypothetical protein
MKVDIFRLISVDPHGIGNKENGLLDLLYSYLLWKNGLDYYRFIKVNQIHQDQGIEEFVEIEKGLVHINIIFNTDPNFDTLNDANKNRIRLDIIHAGLLRLADKDPKFSKTNLEKIKDEILERNFNFELEGQIRKSPFDDTTVCRFLINPQTKYFDYFFLIQKDGSDLCKIPIYRGKPLTYYLDSFFSTVTWNNKNQVVIEGKEKQIKMILDVANCKLDFQNLTQYPKPPLWEMANAEIDEQDNKTAYENCLHSLPPAYSAIIRESEN